MLASGALASSPRGVLSADQIASTSFRGPFGCARIASPSLQQHFVPVSVLLAPFQWEESYMKARLGPDGLHLFDRVSGWNVLVDEYRAPARDWSVAPRQVSVALTNLCDLQCSYCYAPKHRAAIDAAALLTWIDELDACGTMGVGFGGGEPTLHPHFTEICRRTAVQTGVAVTFTTHGHRIDSDLVNALRGSVHFLRVSVDGAGETYERLRGRPFKKLLDQLAMARDLAPLGINTVVNAHTVDDLDQLAELCERTGAQELLLLPQRHTVSAPAVAASILTKLEAWLRRYSGSVRLSMSADSGLEPLACDALSRETGLRSYAHIDASGYVRPTSFSGAREVIGADGVIAAIDRLAKLEGDEQ